MKCKNINFTDFRNITASRVDFSDGINVLWGKNAQGKSNILEGIYYFARGRSFRGAKDREMIKFGKDFSKLSMVCTAEGAKYDTVLDITLRSDPKDRKIVSKNGAVLSGMTELIGNFRAVLFCPDHLSLVSGSPRYRRSFLDIALSQLSSDYLFTLSKYNKILLQRNAALKGAAAGENIPYALWETFASQMASCACTIASYRYEYISMLSEKMTALFGKMTGGAEKPKLYYSTHTAGTKTLKDSDSEEEGEELEAAEKTSFGKKIISDEKIYRLLTSDIEKEIRHGSTEWGIHKDDIRIRLNGKDARLYASQGQARSLALTMKLAEGELSYEIGGEKPVILLDDVLSELDGDRQSFVLGSLKDRQIIVTSCEPSLFDNAGKDVRFIKVEAGMTFDITESDKCAARGKLRLS